jgi:hypothetical protein
MEDPNDIAILKLLLEATRRKMMVWRIVEDSENDLFSSDIDGDSFEIEIVNLQRSMEDACERALGRIQGRKIYQTYAVGTRGYRLLLLILEENTVGWKESSRNSDVELAKLRKRLENKITEQKNGGDA